MSSLRDLMPIVWNRGQDLGDFFEDSWPFTRAFNVDVKETEKNVTIEAELPGFKKDEIELEIDDNSLAIKAERKADIEEKSEKYYKRERQYGKVERVIPFPVEVKSDTTTAKYEYGVLKVTVDKKEPSVPQRKQIQID